MPIIHSKHSLRAFLIAISLALALSPCLARAAEDEETLGLFTAWQEEASAASRAPKPLSQTAENVTVVTAADIEAINAHTLADVLDTIPGIQVQHNGGPGITAYTTIQSIDFIHTQVYVDGVPITNLTSNYSETSLIPAHIIERIEIVKGAASSAWGQALGGVINVITKSPDQGRPIGGTATASIGSRTTTDTGLELSGTRDRTGYYLSGGFLGSNGLRPNTQIYSNHLYGKLTYNLPNQGLLWASFFYTRASMGDVFIPDPAYDFKGMPDKRLLLGNVGLRYPLGNHLELEITGRHSFNRIDNPYYFISTNAPLDNSITKELVSGASAKLVWRGDTNLLVVGSDYNHLEQDSKYTNFQDNTFNYQYSKIVERWGAYLNDTITMGPVSVTPGVRFDHTQTAGDQFSPSLGATWQVTDTTVLRAYTARGYGLPTLTPDDSLSSIKIWTSQVGAESTAVPYVWLKATLFRNQTWNDTVGQQIALGTEFEARTTPVWDTSLGAGYTFTDTTRTSDGGEINYYARHTLQLALRYDDKTYRGVLTGRHIFWNSLPNANGHYGGLLWDLHLGATLFKRENTSLEIFFSGHNLFNGDQSYNTNLIPSPARWFEGGIKVRF